MVEAENKNQAASAEQSPDGKEGGAQEETRGPEISTAEVFIILPIAILSDIADFIPIFGYLISLLANGGIWLWGSMKSISMKKNLGHNKIMGATLALNCIPIVKLAASNTAGFLIMYAKSKSPEAKSTLKTVGL